MRARKVRETIGILLISAGLATLIAVAYQLFFTNITSHQIAKKNTQSILKAWAQPSSAATAADFSKGFALIYIPRIGADSWEIPIAQGVQDYELNGGYGHYQQTAMPGYAGNFALAAHRATHGQPLANVQLLEKGDRVYIRTQFKWFTYQLDQDQIVMPEDMWVIDSDPKKLSAKVGTNRLITLTTCNPRYGSTERWIWWGHLVAESDQSDIPTELQHYGNVSPVEP